MKGMQAVGVSLVVLAAIGWYLRSPAGDSPRPQRRASDPAVTPTVIDRAGPAAEPNSPAAGEPLQPVSVAAATPPAPAPLDEHSLMSTLRELGDSAPQKSLQLARDGNVRFPNSPDAAEREWYVCKSLVNLEDFYGAREEARSMVAKYPDTPWASDVERHLLVNPLDLPGDPQP
jgi:hypothetical protein